MLNTTFSIIKPDATKRNLTGAINKMIESSGLKIVAQKMKIITPQEAKYFYDAHKERSFFVELVEQISSGIVVVQVLLGNDDVIEKYRDLIGVTNPQEAKVGTIRKEYGVSIAENSVHGSDSKENAKREINFFFSGSEIFC